MSDQQQRRMARSLAEADPEIYDAIRAELERQDTRLELIASENFTSEAVLEATGSVFTNKYAEGYPGSRYYGGCEYADVVENLARDRAKAAVQGRIRQRSAALRLPGQSGGIRLGDPAGDTVLGMNLAHGGHLTHGHPLNFSGKTYKIVPYGVRKDDEIIDYDELARLALEHKPKMIIAGGSAYPRIIDFKRFREIADSVGAIFLVDMAHFSGLVAAGVYPNPCEYADIVTSTTHKTLARPPCGMILAREKYGKDIDKTVFPGRKAGLWFMLSRRRRFVSRKRCLPISRSTRSRLLPTRKALASGLASEGYRIVSGGTDSHLVLVDVFAKGIRGKEAEIALDHAYITVNKNGIPFDANPPLNPSGIRLGSPAVTTRGFRRGRNAGDILLYRAGARRPYVRRQSGFGSHAREGSHR